MTENKIINYVKEKYAVLDKKWTLLAFVLLITPLISALIISAESGTSIFRYDAWNTTWSDETSYNITIREIREYLTPQNVRSYNEVEPEKLGYGVYRPTTYLPYVFASFFTGITSHNYIAYCNLLLIALSNLVFLWVVRPTKKQLMWLIMVLSIFLPYHRYVWSGMTEASHVAMNIIVSSCGLYLFSEKEKKPLTEKIVFAVSVILPLFYGTIRGYQFIFLLLPFVYVFRRTKGKRRIMYSSLILAALLICLYLYMSVLCKYCSPYYVIESRVGSTSQLRIYLKNLSHGRLDLIIKDVILKNLQTVKEFGLMIKYRSWHWVPIAEVAALFGLLLYTGKKDKSEKRVLAYTYCVMMALIVESIIMMNKIDHSYRYFLGIWVAGYYILICLQGKEKLLSVKTALLFACMCMAVFWCGHKFAFPQVSEPGYDDKSLSRTFSEILPRDESDPWNNTIAGHEGNRYLRHLFPSYIATSSCEKHVLKQLISSDTVKSKYVSIGDDNEELIELCDGKYDLLYHDYGMRIYKVR